MPAATLHCPSCGAPADPDARACVYCHARLATVACSRCFATAFAGMKHCPACGSFLARATGPEEETPERACPRCQGTLEPIRLGTHKLRECVECGGVWIDNRTFLAICHDRDAIANEVRERTWPGASDDSVVRVGYVRCPECEVLMNRVNFARVSGVVVDVCREHGTWFGAGELRRVVEFVERGGIPRGVTQAALDSFDLFLQGDRTAIDRDPWSAIFGAFTPQDGR